MFLVWCLMICVILSVSNSCVLCFGWLSTLQDMCRNFTYSPSERKGILFQVKIIHFCDCWKRPWIVTGPTKFCFRLPSSIWSPCYLARKEKRHIVQISNVLNQDLWVLKSLFSDSLLIIILCWSSGNPSLLVQTRAGIWELQQRQRYALFNILNY